MHKKFSGMCKNFSWPHSKRYPDLFRGTDEDHETP